MRILFLSSWFPSPPINGAKIRINNLLWYLTRQHEVTLISFVNTLSPAVLEVERQKWQSSCRKVITFPRPMPKRFLGTLGALTPLPRYIVSTYRPDILRTIQGELKQSPFDILIVSDVGPGSGMPVYGRQITGLPSILDGLEFDPENMRNGSTSQLRGIRSILMLSKARRFISDLLRHYDVCTVPSDLDLEHLLPLAPADHRPVVIPHGLDLEYLQPDNTQRHASNKAVFSGSLTFAPNADAVLYYLEQILPIVRAECREMETQVLGNPGVFDSSRWINHAVSFLGLQYDVRSAIRDSCMSIVPLRQGMGTRLKIIESMALGTPVVSTSKGAEGLHVTPEHDILVADTPHDFAAQMIRLARNPDLRARLARHGRLTVERYYDRKIIGTHFEHLLEEVVRHVQSDL